MGKILRKYYEYIEGKKGMEGKTQLGMLTKISSIVAPLKPDSFENIYLFKRAVKKITGEEAPDFGEG